MSTASSFLKSSNNITVKRKRPAQNDNDLDRPTNDVKERTEQVSPPIRKRAIYSNDTVQPTNALPISSSPFSTVLNLTPSSPPLLLFSSCPIPQLATSTFYKSFLTEKSLDIAQTQSVAIEDQSIDKSLTQSSRDDLTKITEYASESLSTKSDTEVSLTNVNDKRMNSNVAFYKEMMPSSSNSGSTAASFVESIEKRLLNPQCESSNPSRREMLRSSGINQPKSKKHINFGRIKVYYFARAQGFDTVPAAGSVALGMERHHHIVKDYSFFEFNKANKLEQAQKCALWLKAANGEVRNRGGISTPVLSEDSLSNSPSYSSMSTEFNNNFDQTLAVESYSQAVDATGVNAGNECSRLKPADMPNLDETLPYRDGVPANGDTVHETSLLMSSSQPPNELNEYSFITDDELDELPSSPVPSSTYSSDEDLTDEFLQLKTQFQPIRSRIRRTILQASGVDIDMSIRDEHRKISRSRMAVGCDCVDGICDPLACACAQFGIGCQVDRKAFPCTCESDANCKNPEGRIEYDPSKVHAHYIHTMMRLKTIKKRGLEDSPLNISPLRVKFIDQEDDRTPVVQKCAIDATET